MGLAQAKIGGDVKQDIARLPSDKYSGPLDCKDCIYLEDINNSICIGCVKGLNTLGQNFHFPKLGDGLNDLDCPYWGEYMKMYKSWLEGSD